MNQDSPEGNTNLTSVKSVFLTKFQLNKWFKSTFKGKMKANWTNNKFTSASFRYYNRGMLLLSLTIDAHVNPIILKFHSHTGMLNFSGK